jgi:argininosuccinate lyase
MDKLSLKQLQGIDVRFGEDFLKCFYHEKNVELKNVPGGTGRSSVLQQITDLRGIVDKS